MKIGLDIHGVITANPKFFAVLTDLLVSNGHEVHILTGPRFSKVESTLKKYKIKYTHFFSITDSEEKRGKTQIVWNAKGDPFMENNVWDQAKSKYAKKHKLDLHIDDSGEYGEYFKTPFALFKHLKK